MSSFERGNGAVLAYGHAAYCAGWKAAMQCVRSPESVEDAHSRKWIESHPPEAFDMPLVWWDGVAASCDTRPKGGDATEIAAPFTGGAVPKADAQRP